QLSDISPVAMATYLLGRLAQFVPVLIGISIAIFVIMRVLPGDVAVMVLVGPEGKGSVTPAQLAAVRRELQLDRPLAAQYLDWSWRLLHLDAGSSLRTKKPVLDEIKTRAPLTIELAALTTLISLALALPIGVLSAARRNSWLDYLLRVFAIGGLAM